MLENEQRLDSIWRKKIFQTGVAKYIGKPIKDLSTIEPPRWAVWDQFNKILSYVSQMKYPEELLKKNVTGYSVVMFAIDTFGIASLEHNFNYQI